MMQRIIATERAARPPLVTMTNYLSTLVLFSLLVSLLPVIESLVNGNISKKSLINLEFQGSHELNESSGPMMDEINIKIQTPVIGVLTQVLRDYKRFTKDKHLHLASSYVKWVESAGAQVIPVLLNQDDAYYEMIFKQTNGLLFPGGDNLLDPHKNTPMMVAAKKLYELAVKSNDRGDHYPIWGTCLGMELLSVLTANRNVLSDCSANDVALPMNFTNSQSKLFAPSTYASLDLGRDYSGAMVKLMSSRNLTYNFHHKCLTKEGMAMAKLDQFYRPLSFSRDVNGIEFIAIFESIKYPFFGVQFHPEKPPFEMVIKKHQVNLPHSREAIAVSRFFSDFFIQQAQRSSHNPGPSSELERLFIYSHQAIYTAPMNDMYEQRYLFPFNSRDGVSEEEFLNYVPDEDEEAPE